MEEELNPLVMPASEAMVRFSHCVVKSFEEAHTLLCVLAEIHQGKDQAAACLLVLTASGCSVRGGILGPVGAADSRGTFGFSETSE